MEHKRKYKHEISTPSNNNNGNISMYLGASAFFISVVSAIMLYREMSKMKNGLNEVKVLKNQLLNIDSKFEDMDTQISKVLNAVSNEPQYEENENQVNINEILSDNIDGESEISYEESDNSGDGKENIYLQIRKFKSHKIYRNTRK